MICRTCLRRTTGVLLRTPIAPRAFSTTFPTRNASSTSTTNTTAADLTPIETPAEAAGAAAAEGKPALSGCPAGTVLDGLNYIKGKPELLAKPDDEYPEWLWKCLEVTKKSNEQGEAGAGDEFSKSKKQRRIAMKRQRKFEQKLLASGDIEALAPKIPLQQQSVNLPGSADGGVEDAIMAAQKREELRVAMRKERRAKIKESNYLKSM